ncbi:MAG: 4Fe-4S binding protein [Clostridiales bacterium]|nr:4Fe-4S binding protein [Clostridiales bacterium]
MASVQEYLRFKKSNCKNCYKCIRNCPVKAIRFSAGQAHVIKDECILCGHCFVVCPQNAKEIADATEYVRVLLAGDAPVVASVAPSFAAYFEGVGFDALSHALFALGFSYAEETAVGATLVKRQYEELLSRGEYEILISSCCPSVNLLIRKYHPAVIPYLAPVVSPMAAHAIDIKHRMPGCKVVFIGPCLSKKAEAEDSLTDAVLTFEELSSMMAASGITLEKKTDRRPDSRARIFPTDGGIIKTMDFPAECEYTRISVSGIDNCIAAIHDIEAGGLGKCFIEMSACSGSCIGGPIMEKYKNAPVRHYRDIVNYAGKDDFPTDDISNARLLTVHTNISREKYTPTEAEILDVLRLTGKTKPEDELNCGSCGYPTCREKAIAVLEGKADISMCLPYLMEKAERFSDTIVRNNPNGIIVVNEDMEIQDINPAAMRMLGVRQKSDVLGELIVRIFDPLPFTDTLSGAAVVRDKLNYYPEYEKYLEVTVVHDKKSRILIGILRDVTDAEEERRKKEELGRKTVEVADEVVERQLRIVHEIASLLGETAAETKIALSKLKETIINEHKDGYDQDTSK